MAHPWHAARCGRKWNSASATIFRKCVFTAEHSARDLRANACTVGPNVVFAAGQFASATDRGRLALLRGLRLGKPVPRTPSEANEGCQAEARRAKADWIRGNALPRVRRFRLMGCFVHCHRNAETRVRSCQRVCTQDRSIPAEWRRRREHIRIICGAIFPTDKSGWARGNHRADWYRNR